MEKYHFNFIIQDDKCVIDAFLSENTSQYVVCVQPQKPQLLKDNRTWYVFDCIDDVFKFFSSFKKGGENEL